MKKFILLFSVLFCFTVYAGDLPESVMLLPDADVFIGEITEIADGKTTIAISAALFGNYDVDAITVDSFEYMTYDDEHRIPMVGDYLAVAAEYKDGGWEIAYRSGTFSGLVAQSDSLDPATLCLYSGGFGFTERMNGYINDGTYSHEKHAELIAGDNEPGGQGAEDISALNGLEAQHLKIAEETEIVTAPPLPSQAVPKQQKKPISQYVIITLISAFAGFLLARRAQTKR